MRRFMASWSPPPRWFTGNCLRAIDFLKMNVAYGSVEDVLSRMVRLVTSASADIQCCLNKHNDQGRSYSVNLRCDKVQVRSHINAVT
jgi:hypothetical protein